MDASVIEKHIEKTVNAISESEARMMELKESYLYVGMQYEQFTRSYGREQAAVEKKNSQVEILEDVLADIRGGRPMDNCEDLDKEELAAQIRRRDEEIRDLKREVSDLEECQ